ncbi:DNA ligase D [Chitinophaga sp.]|uniref:DNA ligase D n=1 Tax=Chitinophaga sp. TaxID=1869181 RepID=UPI0026353D93|nr:DNA ligase D [uncultured Chitinophaga sp.]
MSLAKYKQKRDFKQTSEPAAGKAAKDDQHIFVIQRHHATRLHYDFRLEMDGVLKSWAVPKGPSLNPSDKRLAMEVEDHPYDYKDFQGEIPPGNYGAGYVYIWDKGTYELLESNGKPFDKEALREWKSGSLKVVLHGKKLKGEFALVKMRNGRDENAWLLIKHNDKYAVHDEYDSEDYTPKSVINKLKGPHNTKPEAKVAAQKAAAPKKKAAAKKAASPKKVASRGKTSSSKKATVKKAASPKKAAAKKAASPEKAAASTGKKKAQEGEPMKEFYKPMLATLVDAPFDRPGWIFETKWDGYRAIAHVEHGKAELYSRNKLSFNEIYAPIVAAVEKIPHNVVLDGEVIIPGKGGKSDFQALQNFKTTRKGNLTYVVFDLLYLDGHSLEDLTLLERKTLLKQIVDQLDDPAVKFSAHVEGKGIQQFEKARKAGWEGVIAKNGESTYGEGARSLNWLKVKVLNRQEAVICGFTAPRGSRKDIGALILGVYENGGMRYIGHCGGGFNETGLKDLHAKLQPLVTSTSPFKEKIKTNTPVTWLKPELVCEVKFSEWTNDGHLRQPIFIAMRDDKPAKSVIREKPRHAPESKPVDMKGNAKKETAAPAEKERVLKLNGKSVTLTNQQKIYWPNEKITKGALVDYYLSVAEVILPHLKDRPLSLNRFPNGIAGPNFFQKDLDLESVPSWLKTAQIWSESSNRTIDYLVCNNEATLAWMVNLGCIEINPWLSRLRKPEFPDFIVIDLDPNDIAFEYVIEAAIEVRKVLESRGIDSFVKTSGSRGMHIYIPTGAKHPYDTCKLFAEFVATEVNARLPETTSIVRTKSKRKKMVYLDFLQNRTGQTVAAPYSVRPKPGATVSAPLEWKEVTKKLRMEDYHMGNIGKRLDKKGDLWANILTAKNDLKAILKVTEG